MLSLRSCSQMLWSQKKLCGSSSFYVSAFRRRRHYVLGLPVHLSVCPKPEIYSFHLYMGPLVHPTDCDHFAACPSVRLSVCPSVHPERFLDICQRTHGCNGLKFCMLMYLGHLLNWLDYGHGLLILLLLVPRRLSEMGQIWGFRIFSRKRMEGMAWNFACCCVLVTLRLIRLWLWSVDFLKNLALFWLSETGQIWGFQAFLEERMEGMAWNFACWCILTTFRTDYFMVMVCSLF